MANILFYAGGFGFPVNNLTTSGLGFFGNGFGQSVAVGAYQNTTYITDGNGVNQGPQVNNVQWVHPNSGAVQGGTVLNLTSIPNYQGTLQVQFTNATAVRTQNAKLYIYDRTSTNNAASGVTTAVAMLVHPNPVQGAGGSGDLSWEFPSASSYLNASQLNNGLGFSPGTSGNSPNGAATSDVEHDWFFAISASPTSIGAKVFYGLLFSTEYL